MGVHNPLRLHSLLEILLLIVAYPREAPILDRQPESTFRLRETASHGILYPAEYHTIIPRSLSLSLHPRTSPSTTYTWPFVWTFTVTPGPALMPIEHGVEILDTFYGPAMAYAAARILVNAGH